MHEPGIGFEPDLVARLERMTLAECGDDVGVADLGENLDFGAGRLDDLDRSLDAVVSVVADGKVFGPHTIDRGSSIAAGWHAGERKKLVAGSGEFEGAIALDGA